MRASLIVLAINCAVSVLSLRLSSSTPGTAVAPLSSKAEFLTGGATTTSDAELKSGIAKFYDESSGIWIDVWGEDMHHGYYPTPDFKDHKAAQVDMIDRSLEWAYGGTDSRSVNQEAAKKALSKVRSIVDVGCGVGGSSRHIHQRYLPRGATAAGVSLSPYQVQRATQLTQTAGLDHAIKYQVADANDMPFRDNSFGLVWSMESGEHMPNKKRFMNELVRVAAPGGRILIVTWCHRELRTGEQSLSKSELDLLSKINKAYYLPDWVPGSEYVRLAKELGLRDVRSTDWSQHVAPFWPAVMRSVFLRPGNLLRVLRSPTLLKGAVASWWMLRGYQKGLVRFVLITATKP